MMMIMMVVVVIEIAVCQPIGQLSDASPHVSGVLNSWSWLYRGFWGLLPFSPCDVMRLKREDQDSKAKTKTETVTVETETVTLRTESLKMLSWDCLETRQCL